MLRRQAAEGFWTDWQLPPGSSSVWTTAYVGRKLAELSGHGDLGDRLRGAAEWLLARRFIDGGWGYDGAVGSDADSTSQALLMFAACGVPAPADAYEHLLGYQQADGGFATYRPDVMPSSWTVSHPDVTPVAVLALATRLPVAHPAVRRGIAAARARRTREGLWHSFWWDSFLYGTEANLAMLRAVGEPVSALPALASAQPGGAFETALLLSCWANVTTGAYCGPIDALVERLLQLQDADGGWPSAPILRLTRRDCYAPWDASEAGPLFADPNRLFTSATVLAALAEAGAARGRQARSGRRALR
ncbi:MAG TPA: hypothetical protein VF322_11560 [Gammaproteobacteria bacterium]